MGEGRVKTAFELAMEKVDAMPKLNTDELKEERRKESITRGEAIANLYLQNLHRKTDLRAEIAALDAEQQEVAQTAALKCLSKELTLTQPELNRHIIEGMAQLEASITPDKSEVILNKIIESFRQELIKAQSSIGKSETERLKKEGISGTAVTPNLKKTQAWQEKSAQLSANYTGKLYSFQKKLLPG